MPNFKRSIVSVFGAGLLSGCSIAANPSIPGFENQITPPEILPVAKVIAALRCQLELAFNEINQTKERDLIGLSAPLHRNLYITPRQQLRYQTGSITFSGTVQEVRANGVTVTALIPVSGLTGGVLGPDFGGNVGNTNTETITRELEVTPNIRKSPPLAPKKPVFPEMIEPDDVDEDVIKERYIRQIETYFRELSKHTQLENTYKFKLAEWEKANPVPNKKMARPSCDIFDPGAITPTGEKLSPEERIKRIKAVTGDFLTTSVETAFQSSTTPYPTGLIIKGSPVKISDTSLTVTAQFIVTYGLDGGLSPTIPVSTPRLTSISPSATADYDETGTYNVSLSLPVVASSSADPRKLIYCTTQTLNKICVEEPFTEHRYNEVTKSEISKTSELSNSIMLNNSQIRLREILKDIPNQDIESLVKSIEPNLENTLRSSLANPKSVVRPFNPALAPPQGPGQPPGGNTTLNISPETETETETETLKPLNKDGLEEQLQKLLEEVSKARAPSGLITPNKNVGTSN